MRVGKRGRETGREEDEEKVRKDARKLEGGRGVPHLPLRLTPLARDRRGLLDVHDLQRRVGGRLDPHQLRAVAESGAVRGLVGEIDHADLDAELGEHAVVEAVGAAVHIVAEDDMIARAE